MLRKRIFELVEPPEAGDTLSRVFDMVMIGIIAGNILAMVLATLPGAEGKYGGLFSWIERISVFIFTVEYILRVWSAVESARYRSPVIGRVCFAMRPMMVIDLLAVLPAFLPMFGIDLRFLRTMRLMRVFRLLKVGRYSRSLQAMGVVLNAKREELMITFVGLGLLILMASCAMYYAEHEVQPEVFSSIPATMWWAMATLTTVGYGDVYPITATGRLIASVIAILGIGVFALPAGIIASGFTEHIRERIGPKSDDVND